VNKSEQNKRERIVEAAAERFRYYGIGKTTMQEIATDAGVAVGTLYLYFSNKDDLIVACAERFAGRHRQEADRILASSQPVDRKLRTYIRDRFRQSEETRTSSRHAAEITRAVLRVKPDRIIEESQMMQDVVVQLLTAGTTAGLFHITDVPRDMKVFLYSIAWFFPNALAEPAFPPTESDLLEVVDWFLAAWKSGASAKKAPPRTKAQHRAAKK
jgi:AcrR family transcriptional regulator